MAERSSGVLRHVKHSQIYSGYVDSDRRIRRHIPLIYAPAALLFCGLLLLPIPLVGLPQPVQGVLMTAFVVLILYCPYVLIPLHVFLSERIGKIAPRVAQMSELEEKMGAEPAPTPVITGQLRDAYEILIKYCEALYQIYLTSILFKGFKGVRDLMGASEKGKDSGDE